MKIHKSITEDRIVQAVELDECLGFCVMCGEDAFSVEPDAENYPCECCGESGVFGAEQILFMIYC